MSDTAPAPDSVCALIPAAGRATRLGGGIPKILLPITDELTVWDILYRRLAPHVAHVHVVLAPSVREHFGSVREHFGSVREHFGSVLQQCPPGKRPAVTTSAQNSPRGMGDAIFGAHPYWSSFATLLVVWGDQVTLSDSTIARTLEAHRRRADSHLCLPLVTLAQPYVQYDLDESAARLIRVRQSREGDPCDAKGQSDVGVFCLSTRGLLPAWRAYESTAARGEKTNEVNFLPFLPFLSTQEHWPVSVIPVHDSIESRGINTPEDLAFLRAHFAKAGL